MNQIQYRDDDCLKYLCKELKYKYRDSWLYRYAEDKIDKPVKYICLLNLERPLLLQISKRLRKELPVGKPTIRWKRDVLKGFNAIDLDVWNRNFPKWTVKSM